MDPVVEEAEKVKKEFQETQTQIVPHMNSIQGYGKSRTKLSLSTEIGFEEENQSKNSLPKLNGLAQDCLNLLQSLHSNLDLLAPQLPTDEQIKEAQDLAQSWEKEVKRFLKWIKPVNVIKDESISLRLSLINANLQAKGNIRKAAQLEREPLLGGGGESTIHRRYLQASTGRTSSVESITDSLRCTWQLMVQEVERSTSTLMTFGSNRMETMENIASAKRYEVDEAR